MGIEGTIIGGRVEFDGPINLPNGTRVRLELADESLHPEPAPADFEQELAILRESLQDARNGHGKDAREFLQHIAKTHKLPAERGE